MCNEKMNYQEKTNNLLHEQRSNWPLLADNLEGLKNARLKSFQLVGFSFQVQYNPMRITSTSAKIDRASIKARPCFLCSANRPEEQNRVLFENSYEILCNPYPILREHFTIASLNHVPQEIGTSFAHFLEISKALPDLVTLYNAPKCGASAPDHLHFQSGNVGFMPMENEFDTLKSRFGIELSHKPQISVTAINDGFRRFIVLESDEKESLLNAFKPIYKYMKELVGGEEPMLNILSWYSKGWRVMVFMRHKHHPWQYDAEGDQNILISPGAVDMGGVLTAPLEKDFNKITKEDIKDIMNQVSMSAEGFEKMIHYLTNLLK
jgi:hypothetical protein